jgi:hypothetical protein
MFDEILHQIAEVGGPITVKDLSARLDIEESALEKMLEFLEKKGKLSVYRPSLGGGCGAVSCAACIFGGDCPDSDKGGVR